MGVPLACVTSVAAALLSIVSFSIGFPSLNISHLWVNSLLPSSKIQRCHRLINPPGSFLVLDK